MELDDGQGVVLMHARIDMLDVADVRDRILHLLDDRFSILPGRTFVYLGDGTMGSLMSGKTPYIRLYAMTPSTTNTRTSIMVVTGLVMKSLMTFMEGYLREGCAKLTLAPSSSLENPLVTSRSSGPTPPLIRTKSSFMPEISTVVRLTVSFLAT